MLHTWSGRASIVKAIVAPFHEQKRRDHDVKRCPQRKGSLAAKVAAGPRLEGLAGEGESISLGRIYAVKGGWAQTNSPKRLPCVPRYWLASEGSEGCAGTSISMLPWSSRNGG